MVRCFWEKQTVNIGREGNQATVSIKLLIFFPGKINQLYMEKSFLHLFNKILFSVYSGSGTVWVTRSTILKGAVFVIERGDKTVRQNYPMY